MSPLIVAVLVIVDEPRKPTAIMYPARIKTIAVEKSSIS